MESANTIRNIAVFASGNGSNAQNLIEYFRQADCGMQVAVVVTNQPDAGVIERARHLQVPVEIMTRESINDPDSMLAITDRHSVDLIVLAGFLLMIPSFLLNRYPGRIVNIHPSLLPRHGGKGMYGRHVHEAVVAARDTETGITVHYVSDICDGGRIIAQERIAVDADDTPDDVERKIHRLERQHFARILRETFAGR
ncbi:MAG: phosphoribosylglycinamide formyltransferase [Bacteroidales bacterium]|nr:phosphoribosylglycinamide formyltransferase [Bacteroidales bacterium]